MIKTFQKLDIFKKNIILVFLSTSFVNVLNLLYQLLIAHSLRPADFASFNTLLSIYSLAAAPLVPLQTVVAKYTSEFNAKGERYKIDALLSTLFKKTLFFAAVSFIVFYLTSFFIMDKLKIPSVASGAILASLVAVSWVSPIFSGALQGLESFKWYSSISVLVGVVKLFLAVFFIWLGLSIAGALGALLFSSVLMVIAFVFPLRRIITFKKEASSAELKKALSYIFPVAVSSLSFIALISMDMIMVKYYFSPEDSGVYSIAQIIGKIFLFLPGAIGIVMFPRTSGLSATNKDTIPTLKKSIFYAGILCLASLVIYNIFPGLILKVLTGKTMPVSISLGRFFGLSMGLYSLSFIMLTYFISIKDLRFIKSLVMLTLMQMAAILVFHQDLFQVQYILCINSFILFIFFYRLVKDTKKP